MSAKLLKLVSDLIESPELRQQFDEDPAKVLKEAGLTNAQVNAFYTMRPATISTEIAAEVGSPGVPFQTEFPPCSEEYTPEPGSSETEYPAPDPGIYRVRPSKISRSQISNEKFEVIITGKSFPRVVGSGSSRQGANPVVRVRQVTTSATWTLSSQLFGTFRCSRLKAVMVPQTPTGTIATGDYQIVLDMPDGTHLERARAAANTPDFTVDP